MPLFGPKQAEGGASSVGAAAGRSSTGWRAYGVVVAAMLVAIGLSAPAVGHAGTAEQAELVRLDEDLRKLAGRNAWEGVEGIYARLRGLEAKGVKLTLQQHALGAQAALQLGHIREARGRFGLARAAGGSPDDVKRMAQSIQEIDRKYGSVQLSASGRSRKDVAVVCTPTPFATDARAAIQYATDELHLTGTFDGLLPVGSYTFGAATFVVTAQGGVVKADAAGAPDAVAAAPPTESEPKDKPPKEKVDKPPKEKADKPPKEKKDRGDSGLASGPYVGVSGGSATWAASGLDSGYVATPGTGANLHLAGGTVLAAGPVGLLGELGWTGIFGGGGTSSSVQLLSLGGGLAVGGDLQGRFQAQLGLGRASITGFEPEPACAEIGAAGDATCVGSTDWEQLGAAAFVVSPGGAAGLAWRPSSSAPVSVTFDVGLRSVFGQLIPWTGLGAQLGFGG